MDLGSGMVLPEKGDPRLRGSWVPGTPAKPMPNKLAAAAGGQASNSAVMSWFKSAAGFSDGAAGLRGFEERAAGLDDSGVAAAAPESCISTCNANVAREAHSMGESTQGWHQFRYADHTVVTNSAATSSNVTASLPMFIDGSPTHRAEKSSSQLLLNGMVMLSSDLLSDTQSKSAACGTAMPTFAPVTPEKQKVAQDGGHPENAGSVEKGTTVREGLSMASIMQTLVPKEKVPIQLCFDIRASEQADSVSVGLPSQLQETTTREEAEKQGIDLNKTPQQKPRRKKHRPKVVQEGKPSRAAKSSTPKPATPKPAMAGENVSTKRKYVRRKVLSSHLENSSSAVDGKNAELNQRKRTSSAKRRLDFSSENDKAADTFQCNTNTRSQGQMGSLQGNNTNCSTGNSNSDGKHTDMFIKGQEVAVNSSAGIETLLSPSSNQILETYLNSLDIPSLHLQPSRRELIRENLKKLASIRDRQQVQSHGGIALSELQTDFWLTPEGQSISMNASNLLSTNESMRTNEWKTDNDLFIDDTQLHNVHVVQADVNNEKTFSNDKTNGPSRYPTDRNNSPPYFPDIQKKRKTVKGLNGLVLNKVASFADTQRVLELEWVRAMEGKQAFGQIEVETIKSVNTPIQACSLASPKDNLKCDQLPTALRSPNLHDDRHENSSIQGSQDCDEALATDTHAKVRTKRHRKKEQTQLVSVMSSRTSQLGLQEQDFAMCNLRAKSGRSVSSSASVSEVKGLQLVWVSPIQACENIRSSHEIHNASYLSDATLLYPHGNEALLALDIIVQKMKCLTINEDQWNNVIQEQTALVPYGEHGAIVPFEVQFQPTKKLRHRAKIVLDEETNRVWNLLMGKAGNDGIEGTAADKEKWWEEERRVFQGRADSFIARMHLVQGDRRFSPWKGSVLDSVIGVFLTQNVSDHLSSSAFMSLAARFPPQSREKGGDIDTSTEQQTSCTAGHDVAGKCSGEPVCDRNSVADHGAEQMGEKEMHLFGNNIGGDMFSCSNVKNSVDTPLIVREDINIIKTNDKKPLEYIHSSQNSFVSSQNSSADLCLTVDQVGSSSEANFEGEYLITGNLCSLESKTSFTELLEMAESSTFQELYIIGNGESSETEIFNSPSTCNQKQGRPLGKESLHFPSAIASGINPNSEFNIAGIEGGPSANETEVSNHQNSILTSQSSHSGDLHAFIGNLAAQSLCASSIKAGYGKHSCYHGKISSVTTEGPTDDSFHNYSGFQDDMPMEILMKQRRADSHSTNVQVASEALFQTQNSRGHQIYSGSPPKETNDVVKCFTMVDKGKNVADKGAESNLTDEICSSNKDPMGSAGSAPRRKRGKLETETRPFDWDGLRRQACQSGAQKERSSDAMDSLDWEAVRDADVNEISRTIRERGMNNKLAERIKGFLDRLMKEHGSIDLEWLRDVPPDKAKDFLLSIKGLGLKSVECVRLLTLHHLAFPVDTNVGRICVRLGWVPLQPLPESLQLHLLELYPMLETIQKYLWPRLCTLDQRTLYELHYQMITFGKVFCTKSKPNCNACPMRGECRHFASAFASARLALPGPEDKSIMTSSVGQNHKAFTHQKALPRLEGSSPLQEVHVSNNCEPIIEEPATPEPECTQIPDIEDAFYEDPDEIPTIQLNIEEFAQNLQNYMQQNDMELQDADLSKALIAITPEAASIPVPKLKNVSRLRTEHQVYELPDSHPLLEGLDRREAHDPCPYLLALWTPGETAQSTEPPESCCSAQGTGNLCDERTCFSCNSIREAQTQTIRGTLLIPCRTAMRGSFPLNGTYFQVNEVFADHESSLNPIGVPRGLIWNLPRRTVYFGTSVPTIFRGLTIEDIQNCFWRGFVCVRGFDRKTRGPRPLIARLHFPVSKVNRNKRSALKDDE